MNWKKYIDVSEGLSLMSLEDRIATREETLERRYQYLRSTGVPRREAITGALRGETGHFPNYNHRSSDQ
jgi:Tfp pilus tip-associated adhesin PilY1